MTSGAFERLTGLGGVLASDEFDPDTVTPGVLGFVITFLVAAAVVLLLIDMTRRIRRTRYRAEIAERLDAEQRGGVAGDASDPGSPPEQPPGGPPLRR